MMQDAVLQKLRHATTQRNATGGYNDSRRAAAGERARALRPPGCSAKFAQEALRSYSLPYCTASVHN